MGGLGTIYGEPLVPILAFGQLHAFAQAVAAERRIGELLQLPCARALSALLALEGLPVAGVGVAVVREKVSLLRYLRQPVSQAPLRLVEPLLLPSCRRRVLRAQAAG